MFILKMECMQETYPKRISICGVKLSTDISNTNCSAKSIEGDIWSEDIKLAASRLVPNLEEIIDSSKWHSDTLGLMQLIVITNLLFLNIAVICQ